MQLDAEVGRGVLQEEASTQLRFGPLRAQEDVAREQVDQLDADHRESDPRCDAARPIGSLVHALGGAHHAGGDATTLPAQRFPCRSASRAEGVGDAALPAVGGVQGDLLEAGTLEAPAEGMDAVERVHAAAQVAKQLG